MVRVISMWWGAGFRRARLSASPPKMLGSRQARPKGRPPICSTNFGDRRLGARAERHFPQQVTVADGRAHQADVGCCKARSNPRFYITVATTSVRWRQEADWQI